MAPNGSYNNSIFIHGFEHDALAPVVGQFIKCLRKGRNIPVVYQLRLSLKGCPLHS
mgnify:FL=1